MEENRHKSSGFGVFRDSRQKYRRPLRFFLTAAASAVVDWTLFLLLIRLFGSSAWAAYRIAVAKDAAAASALSRVGSGILNFTLNRNWSFQSKGRVGIEAVRYLVLFSANLFCNASARVADASRCPCGTGKVHGGCPSFPDKLPGAEALGF